MVRLYCSTAALAHWRRGVKGQAQAPWLLVDSDARVSRLVWRRSGCVAIDFWAGAVPGSRLKGQRASSCSSFESECRWLIYNRNILLD
eukprot:9472578-Pyramimonas_sp.AAC.2